MKRTLGKIAFIGMGLIGGSLAKALKKAQIVDEILAYDYAKESTQTALKIGAIDREIEFAQLEEADIIIIAAPVDAFHQIFYKLCQLNLKDGVVISDVGSTKASIIEAVRANFGEVPSNFVPAHPIAGREKSGVEAADENLFKNRKVILTTLPNTDYAALGIITKMWLATGALTTEMSIEEHDEILGATSHLPHVLAYLLVDMLDQDLHHDEIFNYSAGGFKDFTRIASSSPIMWRDICIHNSEELIKLLSKYQERITQFETLLKEKNKTEIETLFTRAKLARDHHYQKEENQ